MMADSALAIKLELLAGILVISKRGRHCVAPELLRQMLKLAEALPADRSTYLLANDGGGN